MTPARLGRYELLSELASGGMGVVYLARQVAPAEMERPVVVKRLHRHLSDSDEFARMFLDEARLGAQVRHPNVVPILDAVRADGELYLVMEYVEAVSLSQLRRTVERPMDAPLAARVLLDALAGLQAAHVAKDMRGRPLGLVHRDVSPQNLLVGADGIVRLIDFGIAKATAASGSAQSGVKGKVSYMAPEQIRAAPIDQRADVFSAGVVLFELLTGVRPFDGATEAATLMNVLLGEVPAPKTRGASSDALDAVVLRALESLPAERYATAADLAEAIERAVTPAPRRELAALVNERCASILERHREVLLAVGPPGSRRSLPSPTTEGGPGPQRESLETVRLGPPPPAPSDHGAPPAREPVPPDVEPRPRRGTRLTALLFGGAAVLAIALGGAFGFARGGSQATRPKEAVEPPPPIGAAGPLAPTTSREPESAPHTSVGTAARPPPLDTADASAPLRPSARPAALGAAPPRDAATTSATRAKGAPTTEDPGGAPPPRGSADVLKGTPYR